MFLERSAERIVAFYNKRGTCEQWIKEGKGAIKWTRLSCRTFAANAFGSSETGLALVIRNSLTNDRFGSKAAVYSRLR